MAKLFSKILAVPALLLMLVVFLPATALPVDVARLATDPVKVEENIVDSASKTVTDVHDDDTGATERIVSDASDLVGDIENDGRVVVKKTTGSVSSEIDDTTNLVEDLDGVVGTAKNVVDSVSDIIPNPILTEKEKHKIIEEALDVPKLKEWSSDGWQFVGMDFIGESKSSHDKVGWKRAAVYLHLPNGEGNPPEACSQGWSATIDVDLETGKADRNSGYPTRSSHECESKVVLEDPATAMGKQISEIFDFSSWFASDKDSAAKPSFVIAEADDVVSNDVYGNTAYLKTPSYEHAIFDHMDSYVAHLLNQKWNTSPVQHMTQVGWLITAVEGCTSCGTGYISKDSSALVLTDTSVFGNLEAHKIPFDWKPDKEILAKTACDDDVKNYLVSILYDGEVFNHNTNIPCENADNDSKISNSVFFENWNTVQSSSWAQDITGSVEAHSAYGFMNSHNDLHTWTNSTNEQQGCDDGRDQTTIIDGSLSSGDAATWTGLDKVASAC